MDDYLIPKHGIGLAARFEVKIFELRLSPEYYGGVLNNAVYFRYGVLDNQTYIARVLLFPWDSFGQVMLL